MIVRNLRLEASNQLAKLQSKWQISIIYCGQLLQTNNWQSTEYGIQILAIGQLHQIPYIVLLMFCTVAANLCHCFSKFPSQTWTNLFDNNFNIISLCKISYYYFIAQ